MNIMLTNHCNLNCKYCFAHDSIDNKNKKEVSFENFKYYISFIKKNKYKKLNLIGGEPTLHTKFFDLLEYQIDEYEEIEDILLFTNQMFNDDFQTKLNVFQKKQQIKNIKIGLLVNYNEDKYKIINKNLHKLFFNSNIGITLGMNIYDPNKLNFDTYFDQIKKFKIKEQRWTIVMPKEYRKLNKINYYKKYNEQLKNFLMGLKLIGIRQLPQDCTSVPFCQLNDELKRNYKNTFKCSPILDVDVDLNVFRCFMFPEFKLKLDLNNDINYYFNYFIDKIDRKFKNYQCKDCWFFKKYGTDCGCIQWNKKIKEEL